MPRNLLIASVLAIAGLAFATIAVVHERLMHRHRQPGVTYAAATFRRDGGYRRTDLFTPDGLKHQGKAAKFGVRAAALWVLSLLALVTL